MSVSILTWVTYIRNTSPRARSLCKNNSLFGYSLARVWQPPSSANRPGRKTLFRNYQQCLQCQRQGHLKGQECRITVDWELIFSGIVEVRVLNEVVWKVRRTWEMYNRSFMQRNEATYRDTSKKMKARLCELAPKPRGGIMQPCFRLLWLLCNFSLSTPVQNIFATSS